MDTFTHSNDAAFSKNTLTQSSTQSDTNPPMNTPAIKTPSPVLVSAH